MTDLAKLVVRLEAQSAQLLTELEKANRKVDKFASATTKTLQKWSGGLLTFFSARALINFSSQVIKAEGELVGMAERAGTTVDKLSGLGYAASQSASSLEGLQKGLGNLADRAADAAEKGGESAAAFEKIGVSVKDQQGNLKNSSDLLLEIADKFSQYENGAAKSALATDLFGKSGKELIPLLNRGAAGIEDLRKKAEALGIVVSQEAAEAANQFSDNLNTLGNITKGVVGKALAEVLPYINDFTQGLIDTEEGAQRADKAARVLATGLKLLLSAGVIISEIFDRVGDTIGAAAAALVAVAKGQFKDAYRIVKEGANETVASGAAAADELRKIWESSAQDIAKSAEVADAKVKKTLIFGGDKSRVQEVKVSVQKLNVDQNEQALRDLDEMTRTASENAISEYNKQKEALETLYEAGRISLDEYNKRLEESLDTFLPEIEVSTKRIKESSKKALTELDEFAKEAARNTQDIIADGLGDALHEGVSRGAKGALQAFGDMLEKMALQAIAKNIAQYIFGNPGTQGDTGGLVGQFLNLAGSYFGGTKDSGGSGRKGHVYMIGSGAQPEMFEAPADGQFTPASEWMGGGGSQKVTQNIYVQGATNMRTARQLQIEAARRQRIATARLG